jgi:hypothetical protein
MTSLTSPVTQSVNRLWAGRGWIYAATDIKRGARLLAGHASCSRPISRSGVTTVVSAGRPDRRERRFGQRC